MRKMIVVRYLKELFGTKYISKYATSEILEMT